MLKLDEKKIRKGKPIGLPYQGSKKKISKKIVEIIKQNFGTDKLIYDIFGGGGAITAECILNGLEVHYNDLDKDITNAFERVISQDREWIKTLIVSHTEFFEIKDKENKTTDDFLKLLVNSFGNDKKSYLCSEEISDLKYNLAKEIIENHDVFNGYKQTETYKKATYNAKQENDKRLQQLERLGQLEQLQQLNKIKATNKSYHDFSDISGAILYLDPPYEGSSQKGYINQFDSQEFYDWAFVMAKNNIVIISSYSISDERFEAVYSFDKARCTLQSGRGNKNEKLFMVKNS
ncbi:site-specific DNA methylase [Lactococcus phage GP13]|nr:site-specific DNA methylase [Lactococcus phage GP13]